MNMVRDVLQLEQVAFLHILVVGVVRLCWVVKL